MNQGHKLTKPDPDCQVCHGLGFEIVKDGGAGTAKVCLCRTRHLRAAEERKRTVVDTLEELAAKLEKEVGL
jgi:hypothetical protein